MFASKKVGDLEVLVSGTSGIELLPHASNSLSEIQKNLLFKNLDGKAIVFSDVVIYKGSAWSLMKEDPYVGIPFVGYFANVVRTKKLIKRLSQSLFHALYSEPTQPARYDGMGALEADNYQAFVTGFETHTGPRNASFYFKGDFFQGLKEKIESLDFDPKLLKDVLMDITFQCEKRLPISAIAENLFDGSLDEKPLIKDAIKNLVNLDISLKLLFKEKFSSPRLRYNPPSFNPFFNPVENFIALSVYNVEMMFDLFQRLRGTEVSEIRDFTEQKFREVRTEFLEARLIVKAIRN